MSDKSKSKGESKIFIIFCILILICAQFIGPDNLPGEASWWAYICFLVVASSLPISDRYAELARYLATVSVFCGVAVIAGFAMSESRVFTIAWSGAIVIVSLQALTRIIIWTWSSWEQVKRGAKE